MMAWQSGFSTHGCWEPDTWRATDITHTHAAWPLKPPSHTSQCHISRETQATQQGGQEVFLIASGSDSWGELYTWFKDPVPPDAHTGHKFPPARGIDLRSDIWGHIVEAGDHSQRAGVAPGHSAPASGGAQSSHQAWEGPHLSPAVKAALLLWAVMSGITCDTISYHPGLEGHLKPEPPAASAPWLGHSLPPRPKPRGW